MNECNGIPTLQLIKDAGTNAEVFNEVVTSNAVETVKVDSVGNKHKTLAHLDNLVDIAGPAADRAEQAANAALAVVNYEGPFVPGVTNAIQGESYFYAGSMWACLIDTSDTPSEDNADWYSLNNHSLMTNRDKQGAHPASAIVTDNGYTLQDLVNITCKTYLSVSTMVDSSPIRVNVGEVASTGATKWLRTKDDTDTLKDFINITPAYIGDFEVDTYGMLDASDAFIYALEHVTELVGNKSDTYLITKPVKVPKHVHKVDLKGANLHWNGVAPTQNLIGRDRGVFEVVGELGSIFDTSTPLEWNKGAKRYPVSDASVFVGVDYCIMSAGSLPDAAIGYLVKPSFIDGVSNRMAMDYILGWDLENPTFTYRAATPIRDVTVGNFHLVDLTSNTTNAEDISGVVMSVAVNCKVENITTENGTNPAVFTYYTTDCEAINCYALKPRKVSGGKGYVVQWNNALRSHTKKLKGVDTRHVVDFTMAAYCAVDIAEGPNTDGGDFITHGSYEHDITYSNIQGTMSIATSGEAFGQSASNISVEDFTGDLLRCRFNVKNFSVKRAKANYVALNAGAVVEDLELYDTIDNPRRFQLNNWSRQLGKDTSAPRSTVIKRSQLRSDAASSVFLFESALEDDVVIIEEGCDVTLNNADFNGGNIKIKDSNLTGPNIILLDNANKIELVNCEGVGVGFRANPLSQSVSLIIKGGKYCCNNSSNQFFSNRDTGNKNHKLVVDGVDLSEWIGHTVLESILGANANWDTRIINSDITQGSLQLRNQAPMRVLGNDFTGATVSLGTLGATRIAANNIGI